jgi:hypothetical protein
LQDAETTPPQQRDGAVCGYPQLASHRIYTHRDSLDRNHTGSDAPQARWQLDGTLRVRTSERGQPEQ